MNNDDDLVFLNHGEDDENAVFQNPEERDSPLKGYTLSGDDPSERDRDLETTIRMNRETRPYWRRVFG